MLKGLTKSGELIDRDAPGAAYLVDTDEEGHEKTIESVRERHRLETMREPGTAHQAVEGVAVPVHPDDTESPEEKLKRLQNEGLLPKAGLIATTQGVKSVAEIGNNGVNAQTNKAPASPNPSGSSETPVALTPAQTALVEGVGKAVAEKLFGAGIVSREILAAKTDTELDGIVGIGETTIKEIRAWLERTTPTE